jgi:hypothetical protein
MKRKLAVAGTIFLLGMPSMAEEHRQLGPHQHGHGALNIAIDNDEIAMDLDAPGADILGFEHEPSTPEQKEAFEAGKAKLAEALSIFKMPAAAGCEIKEAKVAIENEHEDKSQEGAKASSHDKDEGRHFDISAEYKLKCKAVTKLSAIDFEYFKAFPGAQVLEVTIITPKGQNKFEVVRDRPRLDLAGVM